MTRTSFTKLGAVAAAGLVLTAMTTAVALARPAADTASDGGRYVPLYAPTKVLDTASGLNVKKGPLAAGATATVKVTGAGAVPATGVSSVVVSLRALAPTGYGNLVTYGTNRPSTTNLQFATRTNTAATTLVPLSADGRLSVRNQASAASVQVGVEVVGYYTSGTASDTDHAVFHPLSTAQRALSQTFGANTTVSPVLGGKFGVPDDASAVAATVTILGATTPGTVSTWRQGDVTSTAPTLRYAVGHPVSDLVVLPLGNGQTNLRNVSSGAPHLAVDVIGYYTEGVATTAGTLRPVPAAVRVFNKSIAASGAATVNLAGQAGVPITRVSAAIVTVDVLNKTAGGTIQAARSGTAKPTGTAIRTFDKGAASAGTAVVPTADGKFTLFNSATSASSVSVTVRAYVPSNTLTPPPTYVGRYPNQLNGTLSHDQAVMSNDGAADGAAGSKFVLLDLGAQTVNDPLTQAKPGILLTQTGAAKVRISYADLVKDLQAYLSAYAESAPDGQTATIAVGTNNDGNFDTTDKRNYYSAGARGADFADDVIDQLRVFAKKNTTGLTVVGAIDIEAGFASTRQQAYDWENAFLKASPTTTLVYNGSLDGCPATFGSTAACSSGWTQAQYVQLTTNQGRVEVLPQVYVRNQSVQWANIDKASGGKLRYVGVLTESLDPDTFSPPQGWTAFVRAIASVRTSTPAGLASVDIQKDDQRND